MQSALNGITFKETLEKQTRAYKAVKCAEFSTGGLGITFVNFSVLSDPRVQNS